MTGHQALNLWKLRQGIRWCTGAARRQCIRNLGLYAVQVELGLAR